MHLDTVKQYCPCCGELIELVIDPSSDESYVEDCQVCCRPLIVSVVIAGDEPYVTVEAENQG